MIRVIGYKLLAGCDHSSQAAFHISSTSTMQYVVLDGRVKRWVMPLFDGACRDHVGMSGEYQQGVNLATAEPYIAYLTIG
jgi:hypothetical protein